MTVFIPCSSGPTTVVGGKPNVPYQRHDPGLNGELTICHIFRPTRSFRYPNQPLINKLLLPCFNLDTNMTSSLGIWSRHATVGNRSCL